jgi:hypothetical protein
MEQIDFAYYKLSGVIEANFPLHKRDVAENIE